MSKGEGVCGAGIDGPPEEYCHICIGKGRYTTLASVRLTNPIHGNRIFDAMDEIKKCTLTAPVKAGTVVIPHLLGYDADVIVTKPVPEKWIAVKVWD